MSITSKENTDLLRNLLKDHPLQLADPRQFHEIFRNEMERIHSNRFHFKSNLMLMNKEILKTFQSIKSEIMQQQQQQQQQFDNHHNNRQYTEKFIQIKMKI